AANILAEPLVRARLDETHLARVQRRRAWPTRASQRLQLVMQRRIISRVLRGRGRLRMPWLLRLFRLFPVLRRLPARLVGIGVRPEHIRTQRRAPPVAAAPGP